MENKCLTGCKNFHGGEIQHFKDCPYYEGSLSQMYDQLQENCRLIYKNEDLLQKILQIKQNEKKPIKRGFKTWLKYIYNYKSESLSL